MRLVIHVWCLKEMHMKVHVESQGVVLQDSNDYVVKRSIIVTSLMLL